MITCTKKNQENKLIIHKNVKTIRSNSLIGRFVLFNYVFFFLLNHRDEYRLDFGNGNLLPIKMKTTKDWFVYIRIATLHAFYGYSYYIPNKGFVNLFAKKVIVFGKTHD